MEQSLLLSLFIFTAVAVYMQPVQASDFFRHIVGDVLESAVFSDQIPVPGTNVDVDNSKEIANSLADVIEEDCNSVCPPGAVAGGDVGAHVIRCLQCIAEEFGAVMFPEFLEAVLSIRSPGLIKEQEVRNNVVVGKEAVRSDGNGVVKTVDNLDQDDIMFGPSASLAEDLTDAFETLGVSLFQALLGECKHDCGSVTVPHSNPVPCLGCMGSHAGKDSAQVFVNRALALLAE